VAGETWQAQLAHYRWGTLLKKELVLVDAVDQRTGQPVQAQRRRVRGKSFHVLNTPELQATLLAKEWPAA
jgi:hypothetical protein